MSTTPRTDEVYDRRFAPEKTGITWYELSKQLETELAALKSEFEKVTLLVAQTADRNVELRCRAEKAEAKIITARSALSRIANKRKHRGNRSLESQIAFAALEEIK